MNERDIFWAAIEITDLRQRADFVDQACGNNGSLRAEVESLLENHDRSSQFLETPVVAGESTIEKTLPTAADPTQRPLPDDRGETQFRQFLEPADREHSLGRLAHYEIEEILGKGAFGIVAKAFDEKLHRIVAIKMLRPELATTSPPRKRFLREARSIAAVTHDNLVGIFAVEDEPIPYLVMEYVSGDTLQQRLEQTGPLETLEVVGIGRQIAAGMAAAHAANLIHRDIKPSNILLSDQPDNRAKISDFGMARAVDDASMTSSGVIAGTPMYMAPEQARGESLDHRADLFSLGSVLYQMATGRPPFRAPTTMAVLKRVCEDKPRSLTDVLPEIPDWLERLIYRLLEKNPADRYQSAQEVAQLLGRFESHCENQQSENGSESQAKPIGKPKRLSNECSRSNWRKLGICVVGLLVAATLSITIGFSVVRFYGSGNPAESTRQEASPPSRAIAPFTSQEARNHQEAWAEHLGVPVEFENSIGMTFQLIPPGEFVMGSPREEIEAALKVAPNEAQWRQCIQSEGPQHYVVLTRPIYVSTHEVTQAEYEFVVGETPSAFSESGNEQAKVAGMSTSRHPVEMVSWQDAVVFCERLSELENSIPDATLPHEAAYRLLTEAEWEFSCRAGTTTRFWSGEDGDLASVGWTAANSAGRTHPVGELFPNPFGLHDVHGNVWEWVTDGWTQESYQAYTARSAIDPVHDPLVESSRVVRGGLWGHFATDCRSAFRFRFPQSRRESFIGFRVAIEIPAKE